MDEHEEVIDQTIKLLAQFKPKSVFLYGSRGRGDNKSDSDYEVGVIFDDEKYIRRSVIHNVVTDPRIKVYPFKWGELSNGKLDFLFQKSLYIREIVLGAKTVAGENLLPHIKPLPITSLDLVQDIRFSIARALDALLSYRANDIETGMDLLAKSAFYGLRNIEILKLQTFPLGYDQIYALSEKIITNGEDMAVIEAVYQLRKSGKQPPIDILFNNISLLDTTIEPKLVKALLERGNVRVL